MAIRDMQSDDWAAQADHLVDVMRMISRHTDPRLMVEEYGNRMRDFLRLDRLVSLSRRDLDPPAYRIARCTAWEEQPDVWHDRDRLPVLTGGLFGELMDAAVPRIIDDLRVDEDDPAAPYFEGMRSLVAVPVFDDGEALNMVVVMQEEPAGFDPGALPQFVWTTNLFGRATHNLVLSAELREANARLDREMSAVAEIQRSLLPERLPDIPGVELAVSYETSARAGGDYYDIFRLPEGRWGILIADASGHGTPAAVVMAITHSLAHAYAGPPQPPGRLLEYLNAHLSSSRYALESGTFVTAFYAVYEPDTRRLTWARAGHNPPRHRRCPSGTVTELDGQGGPPAGVVADVTYGEASITLEPGDRIAFYTDGITEARGDAGELYGVRRLDAVLGHCEADAATLVNEVLDDVKRFTHGAHPEDDRTLLVARIV